MRSSGAVQERRTCGWQLPSRAPGGPSLVALSLLLCSATLTGCQAAHPVTSADRLVALRAALDDELDALVDEEGLVYNPPSGRPRPLDLYASARLAELATAAGERLVGSPEQFLADASAVAHNRAALPPEWYAWSLVTWADAVGARIDPRDVPVEASTLTGGSDPEERAARLWIGATLESQGVDTGRRSEIAGAVAELLTRPSSAIVARYLWRSCSLLSLTCPRPVVAPVTVRLASPEDALTLGAAARLDAVGIVVPGYEREEASSLAGRALRSLPQGQEVVATELAAVLTAAGADLEPIRTFVAAAAGRRDPASGMYRQYVSPQGTIGATYSALRLLGERFSAFAARHGTCSAVEALLTEVDLQPLTRLKAYAVLRACDGPAAGAHRSVVSATEADLRGRSLTGPTTPEAVELLSVLADLGEVPAEVRVAPIPVTDANRRAVDALASLSFAGLLANSAELNAYYGSYVAELPRRVLREGPDNPTLAADLHLLRWSRVAPQDAAALTRLVRARVGGGDTPHLLRRTTDPIDGCDIDLTALAVDSELSLQALTEHA